MRIACDTQRTPEWFAAKLGLVSASNVWKTMSFLSRASKNGGKGTSSAKRLEYLYQLEREISSGQTAEHFVSRPMDLGTQYEPMARKQYMLANDVVEQSWQTGFVLHPTMDRLGCSPDLLVDPNGGAEFKVPQPDTHEGYLIDYAKATKALLKRNELAYAVIPNMYVLQVQTNIACCEREWWDWMSFAPPAPEDGFPILRESRQRLQIRVERDDKMIAEIEDNVAKFNEELFNFVEEMKKVFG